MVSKRFPFYAVIIFYSIFFAGHIWNFSGLLGTMLLIMVGSLGYYWSFRYFHRMTKLYVYVILLVVTGVTSLILNHNMSILSLLRTFFFFGIALILLIYPMEQRLSLICYYFFAGVMLFRFILKIPEDKILLKGELSSNYISVILLVLLLLYYLACEKQNKAPPLLPAVVFFVICIFSIGRMAILVGALLLGGVCLFQLRCELKRHSLKGYLLLFLLFIVFIAICFVGSSMYEQLFTRFASKGLDSPRWHIWRQYLIQTFQSPSAFAFGVPLTVHPIFERYGFNLHNSFLQIHAYHGIVFFVVTVALLLNTILYFGQHKKRVSLFLFFILLFRAFSDKLFFSNFCEPLLFYFLFYPIMAKLSLGDNAEGGK